MIQLPIALQLYSIREELEKDFKEILLKVKKMGYDGVELAGTYGLSKEEMKEYLDQLGLTAISAHVPLEDLRDATEETLSYYQYIGCSYIVIPYLSEEYRYGGDKYEPILSDLKWIGAACREKGMKLLYHNHDFEFERTEKGNYALDELFASVSRETLMPQFDTGWVKAAGENPADYLENYKGYCEIIHLKDLTMEGDVILKSLGEGIQDMYEIVKKASECGTKWLIVEQDDHYGADPVLNCKKSIDYLREHVMNKLKIGIVGCGGIANNKHLPAIEKNGNFEVAAFCDIILDRAVETKEKFGAKDAKVFTDYRELIKEELDAVYVLTPNKSHASISIAALNSGKHVMCEKPMAKSYEEAKQMVEAAKASGKILNIGYQNRYRPDSSYLKRVCENGDLGEIYYAKAHAIRRRAVPTWGVFLNEEEQGGGPLIDIGTHALDLTLWMMDNYEPVSVTGSVYRKLADQTDQGNAFGTWNPKEFTVEDSAFGFIKMKNGATVHLEASWALNTLDVDEAKTSLCGTRAGADMKDGLRINRVQYDRQCVEKPDLTSGGVAFFDGKTECDADIEQRIFYSAVANGADTVVKPEQAMVVTQILEAIYESAKTGRTVYFE